MKDLLVFMASSGESGMMRQYCQQLSNAGIDYHVEPITETDPVKMVTLRERIKNIRKAASMAEKVVVSDAYDMMFFGTKQEVLDKIPNSSVILAGERNCYPDASLGPKIDGPTPWKYANGGLLCGDSKSLLLWCEWIERNKFYHPESDDQSFYNLLLFHCSTLVVLDHNTEIFYCLYGEQNELQFKNGLPVNTVTGSTPNFIHASGHWPCAEMWHRHDLSIGKVEPVEIFPINIPFSSQLTIDVCRRCRDRILAKNLGIGG